MPCWLLFSCRQLAAAHPQHGGRAPAPTGVLSSLKGAQRGNWPDKQFTFLFFQDSSGPACVPRLACYERVCARKQEQQPGASELSYNGKPHIGDISLTLRRQRPWTTSWKPLWTGLKSAWLEQKLRREKPRIWELLSNCNGSRLASTVVAALPQAAVEPQGCQAVLPAMLPPALHLGRALISDTTDWLKPAVVWLWESQIIKPPVIGLYLTFYMSC